MVRRSLGGKIFKPDLRKSAITRVMTESFQSNGVDAVVAEVVEHKEKGLVAIINSSDNTSDETVSSVIGEFIVPWQRGN